MKQNYICIIIVFSFYFIDIIREFKRTKKRKIEQEKMGIKTKLKGNNQTS